MIVEAKCGEETVKLGIAHDLSKYDKDILYIMNISDKIDSQYRRARLSQILSNVVVAWSLVDVAPAENHLWDLGSIFMLDIVQAISDEQLKIAREIYTIKQIDKCERILKILEEN